MAEAVIGALIFLLGVLTGVGVVQNTMDRIFNKEVPDEPGVR